MQIDRWFPTYTCMHEVDQKVIDNTLMAVRMWEKTDSYKKYLEYSKGENLSTTYYTFHDILSEIKLNDLKAEIINSFKEYSSIYKPPSDNIQIDSWINYFQPGNSEAEHNHYGNYISGVYYVQAMPETGNFEFYDPAKQKTMWQSLHAPAIKNLHSYQPKTGRMLMFPSYLDHSVLRNLTSSTRISIAFNINYTKG